jgi:hypothetical protein
MGYLFVISSTIALLFCVVHPIIQSILWLETIHVITHPTVLMAQVSTHLLNHGLHTDPIIKISTCDRINPGQITHRTWNRNYRDLPKGVEGGKSFLDRIGGTGSVLVRISHRHLVRDTSLIVLIYYWWWSRVCLWKFWWNRDVVVTSEMEVFCWVAPWRNGPAACSFGATLNASRIHPDTAREIATLSVINCNETKPMSLNYITAKLNHTWAKPAVLCFFFKRRNISIPRRKHTELWCYLDSRVTSLIFHSILSHHRGPS